MKKFLLLIAVLFLYSESFFTQNFISPEWKISFIDTSSAIHTGLNIDKWKNVNLLLSWERQGYFADNGKCCLSKKFVVPKEFINSDFNLTLSLQCDIESIYINGKYVGGNLTNQFWSNRDAQTIFQIPRSMLVFGSENLIKIFASGLSYTGGKSHNICSLTPVNPDKYTSMKIHVPAEDHLYSIDDKNASINLEYNARQKGAIELYIVSDFHDTLVHKIFKTKAGEGSIPFNFSKSIKSPGFYECTAVLNDIGYASDVRWFTISPEKIVCSQQPVPGFKKYWDEALNELKNVEPEFKVKKIDNLSTGNRDGYIAEMKSIGGITIRGYYFVPRTSGKHSAIFHVPGYGYGFDDGRPFLDKKEDVVELAICVRGHGISADVFNPGFGLPGIWGYKICSEKENAYRSIYMDCVRAVEFLLSRPEVDSNSISVMGGSQGGGLAIATAGLCSNKIKACAYFDPFMTDTRDQLKIRTLCKEQIESYVKYYGSECSFEDALKIQDLIDTKGFADRIKCPVFFTTSLFDDDCPSHMGFAVYNMIKSPKYFKIYPEDSHLAESGIYEEMRRSLLNQ